MKVLWVSARIFDHEDEKRSGVWQKALALNLQNVKEIELGNISFQDNIKDVTFSKFKNIAQWGIPRVGKIKNGLPPKITVNRFLSVVRQFNPDVIHIWGSENPFKLLPFDKKISAKKVLAIQGVLSSMGPNNLKGMTLKEMLSTIGLREILIGNSIFSETLSFYKEAKLENRMIKDSDFVISQSDWTNSQIIPINRDTVVFKTRRVLRSEFYSSSKWYSFPHPSPILFTSSYGYSWKGLHILIKALPLVAELFPNVELRIAGRIGRTDYLGQGYLRMMLKILKKNHIEKNVIWLNDLSGKEIINNLQEASVYINPSFVESYSNATAEALSIGTPSVISYAGAMPELCEDNKEALFFTPGDYKQCAYKIIKLLSDERYSEMISKNAVIRSESDFKKSDVVNDHVRFYRQMIYSADEILPLKRLPELMSSDVKN